MGEGDGGVDGSKIVDVDRRHDRCPGGTPAPLEARGREPPLLLILLPWPPPRWEDSSPSGPWPPWPWRGGSPSEIGSPSLFSFVSHSPDLALRIHSFLNSRRSVTPIALKFFTIFLHKLSFLRQKKGSNRHSTRAQDTRARLGPGARPSGLWALWAPVCIYSTSKKSHKFQNNSP